MKKGLAAVLCMGAILISSVTAFAAWDDKDGAWLWPEPSSKVTEISATDALFYVQRFGVEMDVEGNVSNRDASQFTPVVYKDRLSKKSRRSDYAVVYKNGAVSVNDVIEEVVNKPDDAEVLEAIKKEDNNTGYILSNEGKVVDWDRFTTEKYELRWYVMKYEASDRAWHIDGVIVEKKTQMPIEIPVEGDKDYKDPGTLPKEDTENLPPEPEPVSYASDCAYIFGYNDLKIAAENPLKRSELAAMIYRLVKQNKNLGEFKYDAKVSPTFADIEDAWFRSGIEFMDYKGAFESKENIYPYTTVTRGETAKMICLGLDFTKDTSLSIDEYAEILQKAGHLQGYEDGDLRLSNTINRAEFCEIYNRIIGRDDAALVTAEGTPITAETYGFADLSEDKWYYETMLRATSAYDEKGYVDLSLRGVRNTLDDYE